MFIVGGIGIAPALSMLRTLADRADQRPLWMFYGNRAWDRVAFREELERLAQVLPLRLVHILQEPPADWEGERGLITEELFAAAPAGDACAAGVLCLRTDADDACGRDRAGASRRTGRAGSFRDLRLGMNDAP